MGQPFDQMVATLGIEARFGCVLSYQAIKSISNDDATLIWPWQDLLRKGLSNGEEKPVAPFQIFVPFSSL